MAQRNTTGMLILLMIATMIMGGCGWISGGNDDDDARSSSAGGGTSGAAGLEAITKAVYTYTIVTVDPNAGALPGGESIHLGGDFPTVANASALYTVFFGDNAAGYDGTFAPIFSGSDIYVTAPAGDRFGQVSVSLYDAVNEIYLANAQNAYQYIDPLQLFFVTPDEGALVGGTIVTIVGDFPVSSSIDNIAVANVFYNVKFDGVRADFVANSFGDFINSTAMFVSTPPGTAEGPVDVTVATFAFGTQTLIYGYTYVEQFKLISVDPVRGHVSGGTSVTLGGNFRVSNAIYSLVQANASYNVTFDGNAATFTPNAIGQFITATTMYVTTPPGAMPSLVDVSVTSAIYGTNTLYDGFRYFGDFELFSVIPDRGHVSGGDFIELAGSYPVSSAIYDFSVARAAYTVYFGSEIAGFGRDSVGPLITAESMYVVAPPALAVGIVEVNIWAINGIYSAYATYTPGSNNYEYFRNMELIRIYPDQGPISGFQAVQVMVNLPLTSPVTSLLVAESLYSVEIDGNAATFDGLVTPLIGINNIYEGYNVYFNMLTPPGTLGLKDAALIDVGGIEDREFPAKKAEAYEYVASGSIGQWVDVTILPNPVGPLDAGELEVVIEVTGEFDGSFEAFIVPQGGDPINEDHRISLIGAFTGPSLDGNPTWTGTNAIGIATDIYEGLYADGHAAIFLYTETDDIVGDDFVSPYTDGEKIVGDALANRHFIIDTIPPVMVSTGMASNFFVSDSFGVNSRPNEVIGLGSAHPYGLAPDAIPQSNFDFPFSTDIITVTPDSIISGEQRAQRFFNFASISNVVSFDSQPARENLRIQVSVTFEDRDVDTIRGTDPDPTFADKFDENTIRRQPAGFVTETTFVVGDQDQVLIGLEGDGNVRARWVLQGGSSSLPDIEALRATYSPAGTNITGGFVFEQTGIGSFTGMLTIWDIASTIYAGVPAGISRDGITDPMHLITKFAAGDRATIYYPRGETDGAARSVMTTRDQQLDPLHIWWMREVNTNITRDNIPANGVTRTPRFRWEIAGRPRAELPNTGDNPYPLFSYQLWQSPQSANTEEFRDGPYTNIGSTWTTDTFTDLLGVTFVDGHWYLLSVMSIDEAGNAELWPQELSVNVNDSGLVVDGAQSGNNWRRFYYPSEGSQIDTKVTPFFWHDRRPFNTSSAGERTFGAQTVIPLPPQSTYFPNGVPFVRDERVEASFKLEAVNIPSGFTPSITWELFAEGSLSDSDSVAPSSTPFVVPRNVNTENFYGDPSRQRPITYLFRAWASYEIANGVTITDATPVNIRFTVVPDADIQEFLRNVQSDDQQPIKEFDRP